MFITFEGPEGSGKTFHSKMLATFLIELGYRVLWTREPGGTNLGQAIREVILKHGDNLVDWTEVFLFLADRRQHVVTKILPFLRQGYIVICDRFADSTLAYQGYGRGLDLNLLQNLNNIATAGLQPDLTILLDIEVEIGLKRQARHGEWNSFDARSLPFHQKVRQGYLKLASQDPERWIIISSVGPKQETQKQIQRVVLERLAQRPLLI